MGQFERKIISFEVTVTEIQLNRTNINFQKLSLMQKKPEHLICNTVNTVRHRFYETDL